MSVAAPVPERFKRPNFSEPSGKQEPKVGTMVAMSGLFPHLQINTVLILVPNIILPKSEKYEFHNGSNSVYFLGNYDKNSHIFEKEDPHNPFDYGSGLLCNLRLHGRRVMIAWMKSWMPVCWIIQDCRGLQCPPPNWK